MSMNTEKTIVKQTIFTKASLASAGMVAGLLFTAGTANAAPEIAINSPASGSTTIVEQYSDGKVATITATPNGITMQDGMPYSVTQITNVPRYVVRQGTGTVTSVPVTDQLTNKVTTVDVVTVPVNTATQVLPITATEIPTLTSQAATNQTVTTTSLDNLESLQLTPTFSTPGIVNAQTKVMKILKDSAGNEVAVPANHIAPGDVIEYHTIYTNTTAQPVNDVNAMVSLPNGVKLVSLNSPLPTLATTGGDSYQTIQQVGNTVTIQENYSGLKWNLVNLASNAPQTVVIRAKVQ